MNIGTSHLLFLSQLFCTALFTWLFAKVPQWTKARDVSTATSVAEETTVLPDLKSLDPVFQEIISLRDTVKKTNSPSTFTQHALANRKLIPLEKKWQAIYAGLTEEERRPYQQILISRQELPKEDLPTGASKPPISMFAEMLRSDLSTEDRQKLYQDMLTQAATGPSRGNKGDSMWTQLLPMIKILVSWGVIHLIVGWSPKIGTLPIFTFPVSFFGNWLSAQPRFPVSQFLYAVPTSSVKSYVVDWSEVQSDVNFSTAPVQCQQYVTFGLFATTFLLSTAFKHFRTELTGCLPKAYKSMRALM